MAKKRGLGTGLEGLLNVNPNLEETDQIKEIALDTIKPNPDQPRKSFDADELEELTLSIKEHGIIQPILVRPFQDGYEIVAGERRYRAAMNAGMKSIPSIIRELSEEQQAKFAIIENLQRKDLNAVEEAKGFKKLMEEFALTQQELSKTIGKSRVYVTNALRILQLNDDILELIEQGSLTAGHGRAILMAPAERHPSLAKLAIENQLSVRTLETMAKKSNEPKQVKSKVVDIHLEEAEQSLSEALGTQVAIKSGKRKSVVEITFYSQDDLNELIRKLT